MPTGRLLQDPDAAGFAIASADGAVHKGGWKVVCYGLVDLLVRAFLVWFEDYRNLKRRTERKNFVVIKNFEVGMK